MTRLVYLDAGASTPLDPVVFDAMMPVLREVHANPNSAHWAGRGAAALVDRAREQVSGLGHRGPSSVIFVSGATEANALAVRGLLASADTRRCGIVSCVTEHPAVLEPLRALAAEGVPVRLIGVDASGRPDLAELAATVNEGTLLVTLMAANNETGATADLEAIADITHGAGAYLHTDASQLLGWGALPLDHDVDLITVSGHKMHGPQGVGALIAERDVRRLLRPLQLGGGQERGLRSGTTNVAGVVGFGVAAELAVNLGPAAAIRTAVLRNELQQRLERELPVALLNGDPQHRLPGTLNIAVGGAGDEVDAEAVLAHMPMVAASTGSACSSGTPGPSPILIAMGLSPDRALSSLRFGLSRLTDEDDINDALPCIISAVTAVRSNRDGTTTQPERLVHQ